MTCATILAVLLSLVCNAFGMPANRLEPRLANGLALTPPMGWDSYNHYNCYPNESLIHSNAKALVNLGLADLGYNYVITDCGWSVPNRTAQGTLTWNETTFPNGFPKLGEFLHGLGLKFGVYADSGIFMCSAGSFQVQAGSLYYEQIDADTFADWKADMLKYDNCYSDASTGYPDADYTPSLSPAPRFANMTQALANTGREILYSICEWGVDFPSAWAPSLGNTWRITNDIIPAWRTIYRQINQFVPQASFAGPGHWPDLDMLEVGNNVFTKPEEQTHMSLWSICKSPLIIGAALKDPYTSIKPSSLAILKNENVISYNQDSLGVAANLTRRYSEEGYDIWAGPLSGGRMVAAIVNWADEAQTIEVNFNDFGIQAAQTVKDVWAGLIAENVRTTYSTRVAPHGTTLLELDRTTPADFYDAANFGEFSEGSLQFSDIYGITDSSNYTLQITFATALSSVAAIHVSTSAPGPAQAVKVAKGCPTASLQIPLTVSNSNKLTIKSAELSVTSIQVTPPEGTFFPASAFTTTGIADHVTCTPGTCLPVGFKIGYLTPTSFATISIPRPANSGTTSTSTKHVEITYINNDVSLSTSWTTGRNARNITIQVNAADPVRLEVPLSGRSSELFSPGNGWFDSASLGLLVPGWGTGTGEDVVTVGNVGGDSGVVEYAADFVGLRVLY